MPPRDLRLPLSRRLQKGGRLRVEEASRFAAIHLSDLRRRSGESYAEHGTEVAVTLRELADDPSLLAVAILHDLLVHPDGDRLLAGSPLTVEERRLVQRMHPLRRLHIDANTEDLDKFIAALAADDRLLPLRMAHRLNDVRHLGRFAKPLQRRIATETLHMYSSIAGRLGMHAWRHEMEDACFRLLQPRIVRNLEGQLLAHATLDAACLKHARRFLTSRFAEEGIPCRIESRIKGLYAMYRKMVLKNRLFQELTDRLALRVIVDGVGNCYRALGVIHGSFHPIPGKLKDYIGAPKENGYRSIHTVVYPLPGISEQPIEIQIRTGEMHRECEFGVAKHGEYKNYLYALDARPSRVNLFRNLQSLREEVRSPRQFEEALRTYFREDHIAVFDDRNELYHLKRPVSALDFICHVYGRRSGRLRGLRINGRPQPAGTLLRDGDTVEPRFARDVLATRDWLAVCHHSRSRAILRGLLSCITPPLPSARSRGRG
ncbi:MAG: GTP pyrophosphokinase [Candidatus Peregrinibacteria bacterium Greene0416_19]|nr:MAG: GTP pyrophosphokinase [Candidatus Peregrinibacteria bacterium Greene0416_19]